MSAKTRIGIVALGAAALLVGSAAGHEHAANYEARDVVGWSVRIHRDFPRDDPELAERTLSLLGDQLRAIERALPPPAVAQLRTIPIWVERDEPHHPCMAYHPAAPWLIEHGMNPDKARCVEIANARHFLDWCHDQPWMVLHELAHGYHHQFVPGGFDNPEIADIHRRARESKAYDRVLHINGKERRHYALTNPMEYFAEASEALFGANDFYPFVRSELARHDPEGYALLRRLWLLDAPGR